MRESAYTQETSPNTILVNFEWRQICAKIECIYARLLAVPTEPASAQDEAAPFAARALTY